MAHIHQVFDSDAHFSVDPITKTLKNESSQKTTVIQKDHNSERFTFEIPRMIEGHDMSLCNDVKVHYINIDASTKQENKGVYVVDDMQISPEDERVVICSWLVSGNATQLKGPLAFSISYSCVTDDLDYCLNTAAFKGISVAEGVYCGDYVAEEYADILVQWEQELKNAVTDEQIAEAVENYLTANPLEETDPTVPAWAKAESKPSYSYNELTDKPTIPAAYTLPVANASTLGGVKPISKTDDMTQGVGVDSEGKLWALPGGGGESTGGGSGGIPTVNTEGTSTAFTATIPEITELYHGLTIDVIFHARNTSDVTTLNLNGYGDKRIYARQVSKSANAMVSIKTSFITAHRKLRLMYDADYDRWVCDSYVETLVTGGGTGRNTLASGSYLVGNGTELVNLKTPAQVLADILPSTAADAGKVPTVQANGTIALAEISGGGGEAAWNTICEGLIPEQVASIVINSDADGNLLSTLDVNELLVYGHVYLTGSSKVRIEMNGLWTNGNYAETDSQLGAWMTGFVIHCRRVGNGIIRTVEGMKNVVLNAFSGKIESVELHASTNEIYFAAGTDAKNSTVINAYYR